MLTKEQIKKRRELIEKGYKVCRTCKTLFKPKAFTQVSCEPKCTRKYGILHKRFNHKKTTELVTMRHIIDLILVDRIKNKEVNYFGDD